jgi:ABC-type multidrug transport system fused ATPase/permease subunit
MSTASFFSEEKVPHAGKGLSLVIQIIWKQAKKYPKQYALLMTVVFLVAVVWIADPLYSARAIDMLMKAKDGEPVNYKLIFGIWGVIFVLHATLQTLNKFITWMVDNHMILDRRESVFAHVMKLGVSFHTKQKAGEVVKVLDEGADMMVELQRRLLIEIIPSCLTATAFLIIGFSISPILAVILLIGLVLYVCIAIVGTNRTYKLQQEVNKLWVKSIGRAYDAITNVYSVKSGAQEDRELTMMQDVHKETYKMQQAVNRRWAAVEGINFFFLTRILLVSTGIYLYTKGVLSLGEVYFFQSSFFRVLTPFEMIGGLLPQWNKYVGKIRMAELLLNTPVDVENAKNPKILPDLKGNIVMDNVCFSYAQDPVIGETDENNAPALSLDQHSEDEEVKTSLPEPQVETQEKEADVRPEQQAPDAEDHHSGEVLHNVTLDIRPGEHIAFVGKSGAGKTTLAMLLNRFYDVTEGSIKVDGVDLRDLDVQWWRGRIGLVLQENIMFNDSILENIRYARPSASLEEVKEAAQRAAAAEFIETLPNGYNTLIGDRGIRLSGGQRQRVAIARAILKKPSIVVLDEATSALDSMTERLVQQGIQELIQDKTACIIAHRLSTVRSVSRIAVFDNGHLIACAPHEELLKTCGIYKEMVELQSQGMLAED